MQISRADLDWAASEGLLSPAQIDPLWQALAARNSSRSKFDFPHLAYYFGALIVISAMGWCMTLAWEQFGGGGLLLISTLYAVCFSLTGHTLWFKQNLRVPGGLLFTIAVCMAPLGIYGLQRMLGVWPQGDPGV